MGSPRQIETIKRLIWDAVTPTSTHALWMKGASATMPRHCKHRRGKATMPSAMPSSLFLPQPMIMLLFTAMLPSPPWRMDLDTVQGWCGFFTRGFLQGSIFLDLKEFIGFEETRDFFFCSYIFLYILYISSLGFLEKKKFLRGKTSGSACSQWIGLIRFYFDNISMLSRSLMFHPVSPPLSIHPFFSVSPEPPLASSISLSPPYLSLLALCTPIFLSSSYSCTLLVDSCVHKKEERRKNSSLLKRGITNFINFIEICKRKKEKNLLCVYYLWNLLEEELAADDFPIIL